MEKYKCTKSFQSIFTNKSYSEGSKLSPEEYDELFDIEKEMFFTGETVEKISKPKPKPINSSSPSNNSLKEWTPSSNSNSDMGMNIAMGDMFGTGIPGGMDMDMTTLL